MPLSARHSILDYSQDLDFAARHVLAKAGPEFAPVWSDIDKGKGFVAVAGNVGGYAVLRFHEVESEINMVSVPVNTEMSDVQVNGRVRRCVPAGQIVLDDPKPDVAANKPELARALAFIPRVLRGYQVLWLRQGTTWPVALVRKPAGESAWWGFVQVATYLPDTQRAIVEVCVDTARLKAAMPGRPGAAPPAF